MRKEEFNRIVDYIKKLSSNVSLEDVSLEEMIKGIRDNYLNKKVSSSYKYGIENTLLVYNKNENIYLLFKDFSLSNDYGKTPGQLEFTFSFEEFEKFVEFINNFQKVLNEDCEMEESKNDTELKHESTNKTIEREEIGRGWVNNGGNFSRDWH